VLHYARDLEFLARLKRQLSRARGRTIYKHVVVIDLSGLGMAHLASEFRGPIQEVLGLLQVCAPAWDTPAAPRGAGDGPRAGQS
jgi:hypothetical protein